MFRYHLLGLLRDGTPRHGYALMKEYRERAGLTTGAGSFYRELQRLVGEGMVQPAPNPSEADARRAPYRITRQGLAAFDEWFSSVPSAGGAGDPEMTARAIFLSEVTPTVAGDLLSRWQLNVLEACKRLEKELRDTHASKRHNTKAFPLLLRRRLRHAAADLQFLEEIRDALGIPEGSQRDSETARMDASAEPAKKARARSF